jgi:hypothetical protein
MTTSERYMRNLLANQVKSPFVLIVERMVMYLGIVEDLLVSMLLIIALQLRLSI